MKKTIFINFLIFLSFFTSQAQISTLTEALKDAKIYKTEPGITVIVAQNKLDSSSYVSVCYDVKSYLKKSKKGIELLIPELQISNLNGVEQDEFKAILSRQNISLKANRNHLFLTQKQGNIDTAIWMLANFVLFPDFENEDLIRAKQKQLNRLFPPKISPHLYIKNIAHAAYYGDKHPEGELYDKAKTKSISLNDIKTYYAKHYLHSKLYISVLSNENPDSVFQKIKDNFINYQYQKTEDVDFKTTGLAKFNRIYFHQIPDTITGNATYLSLLSPVKNTETKNKISTDLLNTILGAYKSGRFYKRMIAEEHVAEFVYADISGGEFDFSAVFQPSDLDKVLEYYKEEILKVQNEKVSSAEMTVARNILKSDFIRGLKSPENLLEILCKIEKKESDAAFYADYLTRLENVSENDIKQVAQKYLQVEPYVAAVLGREKQVKNEFYAVAESTETVIMRDNKEFEIIPYGFSVKDIILRYLEKVNPVPPKKGQYIRLKGIYDFGAKKSAVMQEIIRKDKKYVSSFTFMSDSGQQISVKKEARLGNRIWMLDNKDTTEVLSPDYNGIITRSYGFPELEYDYDNIKVEFMELLTFGDEEVYKIRVSYPYNLVRYDYFEKKSALKYKSEFYELRADKSEKYLQTIEISDYRKIPKTKNSYIPYKKRIITPDYTADFELIRIDYNYRVPKHAFDLPKP